MVVRGQPSGGNRMMACVAPAVVVVAAAVALAVAVVIVLTAVVAVVAGGELAPGSWYNSGPAPHSSAAVGWGSGVWCRTRAR